MSGCFGRWRGTRRSGRCEEKMGGQQGCSSARATRGLGRPSLDARSLSQPCHPPRETPGTLEESEKRRKCARRGIPPPAGNTHGHTRREQKGKMPFPQSKTKSTVQPIDCAGRKISAGDVVRIVGLPDLSGMSPRARRESEPVLLYLRGKYKRIFSFSQSGLAEIEFRIRKEKFSGLHTVWLEPHLLKRKS